MFYFNEALPPSLDVVDPEQLSRVRRFKERLHKDGLVGSFTGTREFEARVRVHLHSLIGHFADATARRQAPPAGDSKLARIPFEGFDRVFRDVIAPRRFSSAQSLLHIVFGDISSIRGIPATLPVGQAFDFGQRGPRSVLAAFEGVRVEGRPLFEALDVLFPKSERGTAAGLGHTKYVELPSNSHSLPGLMFVVTTRDLSTYPGHYGHYVNTPVEGLDHVLDSVLGKAEELQLPELALPLLGAGYANAGRTYGNPRLRLLLEGVVLYVTLERLEKVLRSPAAALRRAVLVVYSQTPQGEREHFLWARATRFLARSTAERREFIRQAIDEIDSAS